MGRRAEFGQFQSKADGRVGRHDARTTGVGDDRHAPAARQGLRAVQRRRVEQLGNRVDRLLDRWVGVGLRGHRGQDDPRRVRRLIELANESVPTEGCPFQDWCRFACRWAELEVGLYRLSAHPGGTAAFADEVSGLQAAVDEAFSSWLARHYAALANLPPVPPAMVHHVPRLLARELASSPKAKVALVVVDGMSWTQWLVIRDLLSELHECFDFREDATFAWLPTLTSVSRQALFAGLPPLYFPDSIDGTEKEPALWAKFWSDHGLAAHQVAYRKGLGKGDADQTLDLLTDPRIRVVGLVVDTLDRIMHGAELGARGVLGQVEHWARDGYLGKLLRLLLVHGFRPVVTSDHGNVEATGCGRPSEVRWRNCVANACGCIRIRPCERVCPRGSRRPDCPPWLRCRIAIIRWSRRSAARLCRKENASSPTAAIPWRN